MTTRHRVLVHHANVRFPVVTAALIFAALCLGSPLGAQTPDRAAPPKLGPPPVLRLPAIQHFTLSNGIPVVMLEKHEVPLVELHLVVSGGSALESPEQAGFCSLTAAMMKEGAGTRGSLGLADAIDFLGARISVESGLHETAVELHTPVSKLDAALELLADVVMRPTFPAEELERLRKARLNVLMQQYDEPRDIATTLFASTLFGAGHPYGLRHTGTFSTLRDVSVKDLRSMYEALFHAGRANIIVVGDVTKQSVLAKLEAAFGSWPKKPGSAPAFAPSAQVQGRKVYLVDKPGSAQSVIRIGRIGPARMTEDYFPLIVMNTILGGSFSSRLNQNLREQHGYTYGAISAFEFRPHPGPFTAASSVQTAVTDKALMEFMNEFNRIGSIPDEELERAKNYVALGYPQEFQTVEAIAGQLRELVQYSLPDDFFSGYISKVQAVTMNDVVRVAKKYIDPANMAIVVVGDKKQVEIGVKALKLGPLTNLSVEDVLGPLQKEAVK